MTEAEIHRLREALLPPLLPYGVRRLSVFGSVARGEEGPDSDIDVLVEFEIPRRKQLGIFAFMDLEDELSGRAGRKVELVSEAGVRPYLMPYLRQDEVVLYEAA